MNQIEKLMMNNFLRAFLQKNVGAKTFLKFTPKVAKKALNTLEVGCGNGTGVKIIHEIFSPNHVDAFDLDPEMVALCHQNTKKFNEKTSIWEGSILNIPKPDATYDSVFGFGVLHHIPDWRAGIQEVSRVLKPNGFFYSEESFADFITHPFWRSFMSHIQEDRFNADDYIRTVCSYGFELVDCKIADKKSLRWKFFRQSLGLMVFKKL